MLTEAEVKSAQIRAQEMSDKSRSMSGVVYHLHQVRLLRLLVWAVHPQASVLLGRSGLAPAVPLRDELLPEEFYYLFLKSNSLNIHASFWDSRAMAEEAWWTKTVFQQYFSFRPALP